ncbi:MAG: DUF366 family protein [Planctomycetota bacterium]|jgi:hypothetical protein
MSIPYTGKELRSHWAYVNFGLHGDSIVSFIGECDVKREDLVDLNDALKGSTIFSPSMVHFIVEHFDMDLEKAIFRQRLLCGCARNEVVMKNKTAPVSRWGDDLFLGDRKLSVSIATITPVSTMIHLGINIETDGTPVPTAGLAELGIKTEPFSERVMEAYAMELDSIRLARAKVRRVD